MSNAIQTTVRPPLTVAPTPENEHSRSLVICRSDNYTPSIIERIVGGAYDPLVFPMPYGEMFSSPQSETLIQGMIDIAIIGFGLHKPRDIVLITDSRDGVHAKEMLVVAEKIADEIAGVVDLGYKPSIRYIHIDENRYSDPDGEGPVYFPLRETKRIILGCIDPRLLRVRTSAEINDLAKAAWFTVPGCIRYLEKHRGGNWKNTPVWIFENLKYSAEVLGMKWLTVCPHEDCKAHPINGQSEKTSSSQQKALRKRIQNTKKQIVQLRSIDAQFVKIHIDIMAVRFKGQRLATRVCGVGKKSKEIVLN